MNLTPIVNEMFSLDIRIPTDINYAMENESSHSINLSTLKPGSSMMSSTPMAPKKSKSVILADSNTDTEEDVILQITPIEENLQNNSVKLKQRTTKSCNSALMLVELFGESEDIAIFDETRKKLKTITKSKCKPPIQLQITYKKIVAQFEVKLKNHQERLVEKIKVIELNSVQDNQCTSLAPTIDREVESYNLLKRNLRYIDNLKRDFMC